MKKRMRWQREFFEAFEQRTPCFQAVDAERSPKFVSERKMLHKNGFLRIDFWFRNPAIETAFTDVAVGKIGEVGFELRQPIRRAIFYFPWVEAKSWDDEIGVFFCQFSKDRPVVRRSAIADASGDAHIFHPLNQRLEKWA